MSVNDFCRYNQLNLSTTVPIAPQIQRVFPVTHVLLQLGLADIREAEGKQSFPGSHIQHVVLLTEQQRGVVGDAVRREPLGRSLLRIWQEGKNTRFGLYVKLHTI